MSENKRSVDSNFGDGVAWFSLKKTQSIEKEASNSGREIVRSLNNNLWVGSNLLQEELEIEQNLKELIAAEEDYKTIEDYLYEIGYNKVKIRKKFLEVTGIDPIAVYLDVENYSKPPECLPKYNYGWGEEKKGVYYFILPYVNMYAIWKQVGVRRDVEKTFVTLTQAKKALEKKVKKVNEIDANVKAKNTDYVADDRIIKRVSMLETPKEVTEGFRQIFADIKGFDYNIPVSTRIVFIKNAYEDGGIDTTEKDWLVRYVQTQADDVESEKRVVEDSNDTEDVEDKMNVDEMKKKVDKYMQGRENKSIDDLKKEIKIPQVNFNEEMEKKRVISLRELTNDGYTMVEDIQKSLTNYDINVIGQTTDMIKIDEYSATDESHISTGSISFVVEFKDNMNNDMAEGQVIMFIKAGELQFPGKFKGSKAGERFITMQF